jgi:hypothetical protein
MGGVMETQAMVTRYRNDAERASAYLAARLDGALGAGGPG